MIGFGNDFSKNISSGNSLLDALTGIGVGLGESLNPKGRYYVRANYKGDGLADTGLGFMANPNYRDWTSGGAAISALLGRYNKDKDSVQPSKLFNNLFNTQQEEYPLKTTTFKLPQIGNIGGGTIGDYGNAYNRFYDYSLPIQQTNFKKFWE